MADQFCAKEIHTYYGTTPYLGGQPAQAYVSLDFRLAGEPERSTSAIALTYQAPFASALAGACVETRGEIGDGKMIAGRYVQALLNGERNR